MAEATGRQLLLCRLTKAVSSDYFTGKIFKVTLYFPVIAIIPARKNIYAVKITVKPDRFVIWYLPRGCSRLIQVYSGNHLAIVNGERHDRIENLCFKQSILTFFTPSACPGCWDVMGL